MGTERQRDVLCGVWGMKTSSLMMEKLSLMVTGGRGGGFKETGVGVCFMIKSVGFLCVGVCPDSLTLSARHVGLFRQYFSYFFKFIFASMQHR